MNDQHMTFQSSGSTVCFEAELALVNFHFFVFFLNVFCESALQSEPSRTNLAFEILYFSVNCFHVNFFVRFGLKTLWANWTFKVPLSFVHIGHVFCKCVFVTEFCIANLTVILLDLFCGLHWCDSLKQTS
jgi:hypothetical protein